MSSKYTEHSISYRFWSQIALLFKKMPTIHCLKTANHGGQLGTDRVRAPLQHFRSSFHSRSRVLCLPQSFGLLLGERSVLGAILWLLLMPERRLALAIPHTFYKCCRKRKRQLSTLRWAGFLWQSLEAWWPNYSAISKGYDCKAFCEFSAPKWSWSCWISTNRANHPRSDAVDWDETSARSRWCRDQQIRCWLWRMLRRARELSKFDCWQR